MTQRSIIAAILFATVLSIGRGLAQPRIYLGVNFPPLIMQTLEVRGEAQLKPWFAVLAGVGYRNQVRKSNHPRALLIDYIQPKNVGMFLSAGVKFSQSEGWDKPYLAIEVFGIQYRDQILLRDSSGTDPGNTLSRGIAFGVALTVGFDIHLSSRLRMDLGLRMGYSPQRSDINTYYYPGLGYSTFGLERIGFRGGHFQPIVALRYQLFKTKRERIREKE